MEKEQKKLNKRLAELDRLFSSLYEDKVMERITERNFEMMSVNYISHPRSGGRRYPLNTVRCAALNMSTVLAYQSIALLAPRRYRGRSQTSANAGAGNRKGWCVLNCPQKMTDCSGAGGTEYYGA